jgi:hypothetical protein
MSDDVIDKAKEFLTYCINKSNAHYLAAESNKANNLRSGIPVTIITTLVATSVFGALAQKDTIVWLSIITGMCSILAAILSGLQTFLKFSELAQEFRTAGIAYEAMRRRFELFILTYADGKHRDAALVELKELSASLDKIAEQSPTISDRIYDTAVAKLRAA